MAAHVRSKASPAKSSAKKARLDLDQVLARMLELLLRHHPRDLTMSKISRALSVPRATLYYYFGNSVEKMFCEAARFGMKRFVQADSLESFRHYQTWTEYQRARMKKVYELVKDYPWGPRLYFRFRDDPSSVGETVRDIEKQYLKGLRVAYKHYVGAAPDARLEKVAAGLKLGFLWGVAIEMSEAQSESRNALGDINMDNVVAKLIDLSSEFLAQA